MAKKTKVVETHGAAVVFKYLTGAMAKRFCVRGPAPKKGPFKNASAGMYGCYNERAAAVTKAKKVGGK